MKKIFYEKVGRKYVPVSEYDSELCGALPKGTHIIMSHPGGQSTRYKIDPAYGPMIAAGRVAEDAICSAMIKASEVKTRRQALTSEEHTAWMNLIEVWGDEARGLCRPAIRDVAEAGIKAMQEEANKLLTNSAVKLAYDQFLMVCELTKKVNLKGEENE
jgi:hypothetical protein